MNRSKENCCSAISLYITIIISTSLKQLLHKNPIKRSRERMYLVQSLQRHLLYMSSLFSTAPIPHIPRLSLLVICQGGRRTIDACYDMETLNVLLLGLDTRCANYRSNLVLFLSSDINSLNAWA